MSYLEQIQLEDIELDVLDVDFQSLFVEDLQLHQLVDSSAALEQYGSSSATLEILRSTHLLSSTAIDKIGLEGLTPETESKLALEAISEKIREKATQWSAKILHVIESSSKAVLNVLNPLWEKLSSTTKNLAAKTWDKIDGTVRAHPYKTIIGVVVAIGAVAAIVAACTTGMPAPNATDQAAKTFIEKIKGMIPKVNWPFGKPVVKGAEHFRVDVVFPPKAAAAKVSTLGWTKTNIQALGAQMTRAFDSIKQGLAALPARALKFVSSVSHTGFHKLGKFKADAPYNVYKATGSMEAARLAQPLITVATYATLISLFWALYRLCKRIVIGGFRLIFSTLGSLVSAVA